MDKLELIESMIIKRKMVINERLIDNLTNRSVDKLWFDSVKSEFQFLDNLHDIILKKDDFKKTKLRF